MKNMGAGNHCTVAEFFLAGLTEKSELQMPLFLLFIGIYVVTVAGNLGMITLTELSSHLHNPMYYFLSSLSFIDFCQSTIITPKMLLSFMTEKNLISYPACMPQLYFFISVGIAECFTIAAMAYDRYVAICNPLLYSITMSHHVCRSLIAGVYIYSVLSAFVHTGFMVRFQFCKLDVIDHYFCDLLPLLNHTYIYKFKYMLGALSIGRLIPSSAIINSISSSKVSPEIFSFYIYVSTGIILAFIVISVVQNDGAIFLSYIENTISSES